eukprot:5020499-Karenia_brevis.AAC.1
MLSAKKHMTLISEALARGYQCTYATTLRTFVDDISSISRGHEEWKAKCKISKKAAVIATRNHLVQ